MKTKEELQQLLDSYNAHKKQWYENFTFSASRFNFLECEKTMEDINYINAKIELLKHILSEEQ